MFPLLVKLLSLANVNNSFFVNHHNSLNLSYKVEENMFKDRNYTNEFFFSENHYVQKSFNDKLDFRSDELIPSHFDWREKNAVSSVKNQGDCGGCWAFSATGAIEGLVSIKTDVLYNLSQQELIDCSSSYGNKGCEGGSMDSAFQYVIDNGLCLNITYPYEGEDEMCEKKDCKSVVKINNYTDIVNNDEKVLKRAVYQQPVSVAIQANKRSFQLYRSGIYSDLDCGTQLDHGVLLVGYGYDLFHDMDYWIIKNSWGKTWGENGYIRIQRNVDDPRGLCGVAMQPSIPL
uniref:Peptidase C1A papain C-terminal domain-containing protein n=1 Tax=viral metagenome TaxID=1070528 RepID=A0A6C0BSP6_9ZZZZ